MNKILQIDEKLIKNNLLNLKQIVFEVTEQCNLNCKYCGLSEQLYQTHDVRENRYLSFEKSKLMIDYLLNLWKDNYISDTVFRFTVSFYGGEPLINISLIRKIIEYIEQSEIPGREIHYSMTTNAMLLDKHMDYLVEKKFNLHISLDGDEKAQSYRVDHLDNNSFTQVIRNVKLLQLKHPKYFNESVHFNSVLHNRNDVESILHFFDINFDTVPRISLLNTSNICDNKKEEFRKMYQNISQSIMKSKNCEELEKFFFITMPRGYRLSKYLYNSSGNIFYNYNQLLLQKNINREIYTGTCTPFAKKMFISARGKIFSCERISRDFEIGYIYDNFVDLNFINVADTYNYYLKKCYKLCAYCAINQSCTQCIYQINNIREKSPQCQEFRTKETARKEKEQVFDYLRQFPHYYEKVLNEVNFTL